MNVRLYRLNTKLDYDSPAVGTWNTAK